MPRRKFREKEKEDTQGRNSSEDYTHSFVRLGTKCITIRLRHFREQQTKCAKQTTLLNRLIKNSGAPENNTIVPFKNLHVFYEASSL